MATSAGAAVAEPLPDLPAVTAIVVTRDRPALLARAVDAILAQDYAGELGLLIVVDQAGDDAVPSFADRRVRVMHNERKPGLAGGRNTGVLAATTELVAFCDDDDVWAPDKLSAQVLALKSTPEADLVTCATEVVFGGRSSPRTAGTDVVRHEQLLASRMSMLHSSTILARRTAVTDRIGLVNENAPGGQNEDWDLLLRASALQPIVHVDRPLVTVHWAERSYFNREWETKISSLVWMMQQHPDLLGNPVGAARVFGQIGFGHAAMHQRSTAVRWAARAIRRNWKEPRAYLTLAAAAGVPAETILRTLHRRGRGV
jgi:glycosyltransferase involved in cell wall biosynthesis